MVFLFLKAKPWFKGVRPCLVEEGGAEGDENIISDSRQAGCMVLIFSLFPRPPVLIFQLFHLFLFVWF